MARLRYREPMPVSAGLLMYRRRGGALEVLLAHPGGPFFARQDEGSWSVPKGLVEDGEADLDAARREFEEETSLAVDADDFLDLGEVRQKGGKRVRAFAFEGDCDPAAIESNTFELEWPPRSGQRRSFPEIDRAAWFALDEARRRILAAQTAFLDRLERELGEGCQPGAGDAGKEDAKDAKDAENAESDDSGKDGMS